MKEMSGAIISVSMAGKCSFFSWMRELDVITFL